MPMHEIVTTDARDRPVVPANQISQAMPNERMEGLREV
jgi:hypothetical protein